MDASICCILHSREEVVIHRIECHSKGTVNNTAIYMDANVNFHDIVLLKHRLAACIWGVVGSNVVKVQSSWKTHASNHSIDFR